MEPFARRVRQAQERGLVTLRFRHRADELTVTGGAVDGVRGAVLAPSSIGRGEPSSRDVAGEFEIRAQAVVVTSGGIGANHELVRANWPERLGTPPEHLLSGVPDHVDGRMLEVVRSAGGQVVNLDRMWHYPEGIRNHSPVWTRHGIRILPGPSSLWLDATGRRLPTPLFPGSDALGALAHVARSGHGHSWFLLNERIISREFALSGSEQNPDLTGRDVRLLVRSRLGSGPSKPVQDFLDRGEDFIVRPTLPELAKAMNELVGQPLIDPAELEREVVARDRQIIAGLGKDHQVNAIREARRYLGDRIIRVARPHPLLSPAAGPLIAVRLSLLTRKTLGGLHTDLAGRVVGASGEPVGGLYAAGEVAGFGGGGMHGSRSLEGTFLGGCIFSGRTAGRAAAAAVS